MSAGPDVNPTAPRAPRAAAVAAFAALYLTWGSTYLGSKVAMRSFPPALLSGIRFIVAAFAMAAVLAAMGRLRARDFARWPWWRNCGGAGVLLFAVANVMVSTSVLRIPTGVSALIVAITSVWIVTIDRMVARAGAPPWTIILGLASGITGVAVLGGGAATDASALDRTGVLIALGSTLVWSTGTMLAKHAHRPPSVWAASVMQMLVGGLAALAWSAFAERDRWPAWQDIQPESVWAIAYLVTFGSLVGFSAYVWLLSTVNAAAVASYAYVNPLIALVLGTLVAGESIPARAWTAAPFILGAVALLQFARPPKRGEMPVEEE